MTPQHLMRLQAAIKRTVIAMFRLSAICVLAFCSLAFAGDDYRQQPCKTTEIASSCIRIHGRLVSGNGTPSSRLWHIGTHHVYGIYSNRYGFMHDDQTLDNEAPELHFKRSNGMPDQGGWTIYGDFEVCPLEPNVPGHMQAACIAGAEHIVVPQD